MIKIQCEPTQTKSLPTLPFVTMVKSDTAKHVCKLYYQDEEEAIRFIYMHTGISSGEVFNDIEEVMDSLNDNEVVMDAELNLKER